MQKIINEVRETATKAAEKVMSGPFGSAVRDVLRGQMMPLNFLKRPPWEQLIPVDEYISQEEWSRLNAKFDPRGCVGRTTLTMYLLEKYFPGTNFHIGEVVVDDLAQRMHVIIMDQTDPQKRYEMASELLMYEDPHPVIMVDGVQFDPIVRYIKDLKHPVVKVHNQTPWQVVASFQLHNQALTNKDLVERVEMLRYAEIFCPTRNIAQSLLACKAGLDIATPRDFDEFLGDGHNARVEHQLLQIFGDWRILRHYPREVVEILDQEMESQMSAALEGESYAE